MGVVMMIINAHNPTFCLERKPVREEFVFLELNSNMLLISWEVRMEKNYKVFYVWFSLYKPTMKSKDWLTR
jgi:hypothetical protein